jgi:hypothetical protein
MGQGMNGGMTQGSFPTEQRRTSTSPPTLDIRTPTTRDGKPV